MYTIMKSAILVSGVALMSAAAAANAAGNPVVHHVSVGGNDACEYGGQEPGCDGNFSLTAIQKLDGSVQGQWQDTFAGGGAGIHVAIDCVNVDGNEAIVSGLITHGSTPRGTDVTGWRAFTAAVDNGRSKKDPADQIGFSIMIPADEPISCDVLSIDDFLAVFETELLDLTRGQVTVR